MSVGGHFPVKKPTRMHPGSATTIPTGGFSVPTGPPANGAWFVYEGAYYRYNGATGGWFDESGNQAWIPIWFTTSPFDFINEGVFAASADSVPYPVWANNNQGDAGLAPGAMAEHIEQMRGVLVMGFIDSNTSMSIPIRDHDLAPDGTTIYGDPLIDPAVPPIVCFRYNVGSNETSDKVDVTSFSGSEQWTDNSVGARSIPASTGRQFDVSVVLEKEPQPHWVLNVGYARQGVSLSTTFCCWLVGCGAPTARVVTNWEVGSSGNSGHYKIYLPFEIDSGGRQTFLTDGSGGARTQFNSRMMYWNQDYTGPNNDPTAGAFDGLVYLTDTGATGGGDVFDTGWPPCVFVFGDDQLDQNRGTTVANMQMSSLGMGFEVDGYLAPDDTARSIENPATDEYCSFSRVGRFGAGPEWAVRVYNRCNSLNISGNARAPAAGAGNRHYVVIAFGPDIATDTASAGNRYWSKAVAASTMNRAHLQERGLWLARANVYGGYGAVWWTTTGAQTGDNLFDLGLPLGARIMASDPKQPTAFTINGQYGPMLRPDVTGSDGQFSWTTKQSGGKWVTLIYMGGSSGANSQGDNANRQLYVYAMGKSA